MLFCACALYMVVCVQLYGYISLTCIYEFLTITMSHINIQLHTCVCCSIPPLFIHRYPSWSACDDGLSTSNITRDVQMACTTADYDWSKKHASGQLLLRHTDLFIHNINLWLFNANYVCVLFSMLYGACYVLAFTGPYMCCDLHTHTYTHTPTPHWVAQLSVPIT